MPPVTPSAIKLITIGELESWKVGELLVGIRQLTNSRIRQRLLLYLFYDLRHHFLLRDGRLLVLPDRDRAASSRPAAAGRARRPVTTNSNELESFERSIMRMS
jgi:hypothetical protein